MKSFWLTISIATVIMVVYIASQLLTYQVGYAGEKGPWFADTNVARSGWTQFQSAGCAQCHSILGQQGQSAGPDLTYAGLRWNEEILTKLIRDPRSIYPNTMMPSFGNLSDDEVKTIAKYLATLK